MIVFGLLLALGVVGGLLAGYLPLSGKAALGLSLLPPLACVALAFVFC
jgi:hypothetical protein